ncbi:MAG: hypothetical protein BGN96_10320 [Bacteroidales bacterium 45-6]|nr:MAG: hypothetical protein BGN96_10320 [Bacteroidales bacterium 45-6]
MFPKNSPEGGDPPLELKTCLGIVRYLMSFAIDKCSCIVYFIYRLSYFKNRILFLHFQIFQDIFFALFGLQPEHPVQNGWLLSLLEAKSL